jgi:hypothetical protein
MLALPVEDGVAKVTPFELAAALTRYFKRPFSPEGFSEDLRIFYLAQRAASGIIAAGNWRLKAFHSGLNGFVENHLQIDEQRADDWLSCLLFIYFTRYGKVGAAHNGEMAYGFGAFLSLADLCRIAALPDLFYQNAEQGKRPPLLAHCILMYLDLSGDSEREAKKTIENGRIQIYFDLEEDNAEMDNL